MIFGTLAFEIDMIMKRIKTMKFHNCKIITGIRIRHVLNWVDDNSFILTDRHTSWDLSSLLLSERGGSPHQLDDRPEGQAIY